MKKRKQFLKKIGAVLCTCVLFISVFSSGFYYASTYPDISTTDYWCCDNCPYIIFLYNGEIYMRQAKTIFFDSEYVEDYGYKCGIAYSYNSTHKSRGFYIDDDFTWVHNSTSSYSSDGVMLASRLADSNYKNVEIDVLYVSCDVYDTYGNLVYKKGEQTSSPVYNSSLGYLQNVTRKSTYIRDELYNYDDDSLTYHWYHDLSSTGGVDLSSGDYKIRHYISNAKVKGYDKADIVEISEKYLMNEYDAAKGYFSYLQKDYLEKLETLGYEEIGFIDKYLKGYFTLQHHYFQIVNTSTNEVGGYLHFYPKDASGENFGVEMVYEGLDLNDEIDPDAPNGFIDTDVGSGTTMEDALENADAPKLDDLGGIDPLIENLEGYASQITNVTNGIGALLGSLPPWFVGLLGLSFGLFFVLVAVKVLRG